MTEEELEAKRAAVAEEKRKRLERQRELVAAAGEKKDEAEMEANLRANYYYPTARKRYLPRIKLVADGIGDMEGAVKDGRWGDVKDFVDGVAADAAGPMKLYASALSGGGLSLQGSFISNLEKYTAGYERELNKMKKSVKKKDTGGSLKALDGLNENLQAYRVTAKIDTPDGGVGEIPTDLRVGSGFGNNNPALYDRNYKNIQNKVSSSEM